MKFNKFNMRKVFKKILFLSIFLTATLNLPAQISQPVPIGLAEWWTADGNALGARNRNDAALQNGAGFASGKVGQAFIFDGSNDFVSVPKTAALNFGTGDFSVEFWVKWNNVGSGGMISGDNFGAAGDYNGWLFNDDGNSGGIGWMTRKASVGTAQARIATSNFTNGVWYHLAGIRTGRTLQLYVNGALAASDTESAPIDVSNNYELRIGSLSAAAPQYFNGQIDEPALYNRALSASEVQAIFSAGSAGKIKPTATDAPSGQIAWLAGDGNADDISGNGNNAALNGAGFAVSNIGQGFNLDGVDDYLSTVNSASLAPTNITVEGWFNFANNAGAKILVAKSTAGSPESYIIYYSGGTLNGAVGSPAGSGAILSTTFTPTVNTWYHIAYSFDDASDTQILFINGTQAAVGTTASSIITDASPLLIGAESNGAGFANFFAGKIDEVSLYNRALSAIEIASIYNAGQAGKLKTAVTSTDLRFGNSDFGFDSQQANQKSKIENQRSDIFSPQAVTTTVGDATVTFQSVSSGGITQQIPLDLAQLPALPGGATSTGLAYDIATSAVFTGNITICFNLPALSAMNFANLRVYHLENGVWVNRTATGNISPNLCTNGVTSLSPFAIVSVLAPTAANVAVSGKVLDGKNGIKNVRVQLTDSNSITRTATTNSFGFYRFENVVVGENYILSVSAKKYQFTNPTRIIAVSDEIMNEDFVADK